MQPIVRVDAQRYELPEWLCPGLGNALSAPHSAVEAGNEEPGRVGIGDPGRAPGVHGDGGDVPGPHLPGDDRVQLADVADRPRLVRARPGGVADGAGGAPGAQQIAHVEAPRLVDEQLREQADVAVLLDEVDVPTRVRADGDGQIIILLAVVGDVGRAVGGDGDRHAELVCLRSAADGLDRPVAVGIEGVVLNANPAELHRIDAGHMRAAISIGRDAVVPPVVAFVHHRARGPASLCPHRICCIPQVRVEGRRLMVVVGDVGHVVVAHGDVQRPVEIAGGNGLDLPAGSPPNGGLHEASLSLFHVRDEGDALTVEGQGRLAPCVDVLDLPRQPEGPRPAAGRTPIECRGRRGGRGVTAAASRQQQQDQGHTGTE